MKVRELREFLETVDQELPLFVDLNSGELQAVPEVVEVLVQPNRVARSTAYNRATISSFEIKMAVVLKLEDVEDW